MRNRKPPLEITAAILDKAAEIAVLVGHVNHHQGEKTAVAVLDMPLLDTRGAI